MWQLSCLHHAFSFPSLTFCVTSHSLPIRPAVSHTGSFSVAIAVYAVPFAFPAECTIASSRLPLLVIEFSWRAVMPFKIWNKLLRNIYASIPSVRMIYTLVYKTHRGLRVLRIYLVSFNKNVYLIQGGMQAILFQGRFH